ncbi:hypothetical protein BG000_004602, partial [Podila horticola]
MSQPTSFQFQPTKGPGHDFRAAPTPHVKNIVFQIESANTVANPHLPPRFFMATNSPQLGNDMDKEEPFSETDSDHSDDDSDGSGAEPMDEDGEGTTEPKPVKVKRGPRTQPEASRCRYITNCFGLITISEASRLAGIHERTGRHVMQKYMQDPDAGIPVNLKPPGGAGRPPKLNKEHTVYIKKFFNGAADSYVKDLQAAIKRGFNGLEVSETTLQRHIKKHSKATPGTARIKIRTGSTGGTEEM